MQCQSAASCDAWSTQNSKLHCKYCNNLLRVLKDSYEHSNGTYSIVYILILIG